jgi:PLP dependent protein
MTLVQDRVDAVLKRIELSATRVGRDGDAIQLVAVSKTKTAEEMNAVGECLLLRGRKVVYGENYLQEYREKRESLSVPHEAHFIGTFQSNKAAEAVRLFNTIQSVGSMNGITRLNHAANQAGKNVPILLQVNISNDGAKRGFSREDILAWLKDGGPRLVSNISLRGLMTITRFYATAEEAREDYRRLRGLRDEVFSQNDLADYFYHGKCEMSMGMSQDFEVAIEEGATVVRIGTLLFGER